MSCVFTISQDVWQVQWQGQVLPTEFNSRGAALAYLAGLKRGRKPS